MAKSKKKTASKKSARKPAAKRRRTSAKPKASLAPVPVRTGKGLTPMEIGTALVKMYNEGKFQEICDMFWSPDVVSVEGVGMEMAWNGRKAVEAKNEWWMGQNTVHSTSAKGPFVGSSGFAVQFAMDVEEKATGKRTAMTEVGVYTVKNGRIVREEFMYALE